MESRKSVSLVYVQAIFVRRRTNVVRVKKRFRQTTRIAFLFYWKAGFIKYVAIIDSLRNEKEALSIRPEFLYSKGQINITVALS